jgi:hypothetical protein
VGDQGHIPGKGIVCPSAYLSILAVGPSHLCHQLVLGTVLHVVLLPSEEFYIQNSHMLSYHETDT